MLLTKLVIFRLYNSKLLKKQLCHMLQNHQYLDEQKLEKSFVAAVMKECCENYRYKFSQFKAVFEFRKLQESATGNENTVPQQRGPDVEYKGLEAYSKAFKDRVVKAEVETA